MLIAHALALPVVISHWTGAGGGAGKLALLFLLRGDALLCYNAGMSGERDKASEKRRWPWWLKQPEVSCAPFGCLPLILIVVFLLTLIFNLLVTCYAA